MCVGFLMSLDQVPNFAEYNGENVLKNQCFLLTCIAVPPNIIVKVLTLSDANSNTVIVVISKTSGVTCRLYMSPRLGRHGSQRLSKSKCKF